MSPFQGKEAFQNALLRWFEAHSRNLPWRVSYTPYHIMLSEVMLQQTQMERGVTYFKKWIQRFPSISDVAESERDEILRYWQGLGYYSRARNLHLAAKIIVVDFNGEIPSSYDALLTLPGIGKYTASAIASIAFNADISVVDANVERIFSRLFDISTPLQATDTKKKIKRLADELLVEGRSRLFNQALMDLGGTVCTSKNPDCGVCPVSDHCKAYMGNFVNERPVKSQKIQQIHIEMATGILLHKEHIFIQQRNDDDIWGGLWEFPGGRLQEGETADSAVKREYCEETGYTVSIRRKITTVVHFHTKYKVTLHCFLCCLNQEMSLPNLSAAQNYHWITEDELNNYAFPAGHRKCIEYIHENEPDIFINRY